ncbi:Oxidoreductase, short-chain dehydrogenase/reductase family [Salipiger mucosus DSM 16094]|uniref:Oxidoreductase, short-chain dehydrogenase/reductase family n=1 Tax=Salipiger mucosus DSM 16094 TaxID=1123237 RepID=S9S6Q3_9RHOB|nr:Oxidoreductase, short-chain dehydrogenase/reductase family [Salipiger mucosus DSM 16094]
MHAGPLTPASHIDGKDWARSVDTNLRALGHLVPYITPLLGADGLALFFEDDHAGEKFYGHYGTTKAGQIALARSWAAETVKTGPRVEILSPQPMDTTVRMRFHPGEDKSVLARPADEAARLLGGLDLP